MELAHEKEAEASQVLAGSMVEDTDCHGVDLSWTAPASPKGKEKGKGKGVAESQQGKPFLLSENLPPVPAKLVTKIQRGDYIDIAELLRDNIEATWRWGEEEGPPCSSEAGSHGVRYPIF